MSPKLALHQAIESLSESECQKLLTLIGTWQAETLPMLNQLVQNPTFRVPSQGLPIFTEVSPILGDGQDASEQLIEERR